MRGFRKLVNPSYFLSQRSLRLAASALMVLIVALVFTSYTQSTARPVEDSDTTSVVVVADGVTYAVTSRAETINSLLAEVDISVGPYDSVMRNGIEVRPHSSLIPPSRNVGVAAQLTLGEPSKSLRSPNILVEVVRGVPITIHEEGFVLSIGSSKESVGAALEAQGVLVTLDDMVTPLPDTPLNAGIHIYVHHSYNVKLTVGGETVNFHSTASTVGELLGERSITLGPLDRVSPALDTPLRDGLAPRVVRVTMGVVTEEDALPYPVAYADDPDTEIGVEQLVSSGRDGSIHRQYTVVYENGKEMSRYLVNMDLVAPVEELISIGMKSPPPLPAPVVGIVQPPYSGQAMEVFATWYNAVSAGGNITATGVPLDFGICATDPYVIPMGTRMYVPGYGECVAADTGSLIKGNRIDVGYPGDTVGQCCTGWITIRFLD